MSRRSVSAAHVKPKTYAKRLKSMARSVRTKVAKNFKSGKAKVPYNSLFPVK